MDQADHAALVAYHQLSQQITMDSHGIKRIDEILFQVQEQTSGSLPFPAEHQVVFDQVAFSYDEKTPVLRQLSFTFAQGSLTALVGSSGAGKSTVDQLLARFYDPDMDTLRIGGQDIREIDNQTLMANIGLVFQDSREHPHGPGAQPRGGDRERQKGPLP